MLNREGMRAARDVRPNADASDQGLRADPMLRHAYGGPLEAAAEAFLINAFEQNGSAVLGGGEVPPVLVSAAMHIVNRSAWTQPSDEQVKAAMFLSQRAERPRPDAASDAGAASDAEGEDAPRRAA
jgi:hypothetical protein